MTGGYDAGYRRCECFWGRSPGSLVRRLPEKMELQGRRVLDLGCGEGKNAVFLAERGCTVVAVDCSELALQNARLAWGKLEGIAWVLGDIRSMPLDSRFDIVILYGLLHCLDDERSVRAAISRSQAMTVLGGINIVCSFNSRSHHMLDVAHPGFAPCLLAHEYYLNAYQGWSLAEASDSDLVETHPHNGILHSHSMTRFIAERTAR